MARPQHFLFNAWLKDSTLLIPQDFPLGNLGLNVMCGFSPVTQAKTCRSGVRLTVHSKLTILPV